MAHDLHRRSTAPMADTAAITFLPYHHTVCTIRIATTPTHDLHRCVTTCRLPPSRLYPSTLNCSRPLLSSPLHANSLLSSYGSCHVVPLRLLPYHHHSPPSGHPSPLRLHVICLDAQLNRSCHPPLLLTSLRRLLPSFFPLCGSSHVVPLRLLPYAPPPFATLCAPSATFATTPTRDLPRRSTAPATPPRLFLTSSRPAHYRASSILSRRPTTSSALCTTTIRPPLCPIRDLRHYAYYAYT
jgi:hypothetical protein